MSSADPRGSSSGSHLVHVPSNRGRIAIFIDGNNLFHAARSAGVEIDYAKLLTHLRGDDPLLRAFFYTGVDQQAERQQGFLLWMRRNGYRVVQKELKTFPDGTKKANLDVEIAVDMLSLADKYDTAILVSGDEDFTYALNVIAYKGVRVEVAGFRANTSPRLIDVADRFHELDNIIAEISKSPSKRDSQQTDVLRVSGEWSLSEQPAPDHFAETSSAQPEEPVEGQLPTASPEEAIGAGTVVVEALQLGDYPAHQEDWEMTGPLTEDDEFQTSSTVSSSEALPKAHEELTETVADTSPEENNSAPSPSA